MAGNWDDRELLRYLKHPEAIKTLESVPELHDELRRDIQAVGDEIKRMVREQVPKAELEAFKETEIARLLNKFCSAIEMATASKH